MRRWLSILLLTVLAAACDDDTDTNPVPHDGGPDAAEAAAPPADAGGAGDAGDAG